MNTSTLLLVLGSVFLTSCIRFNSQDVCAPDAAVRGWIDSTARRIQVINTDSTLTPKGIAELYSAQQQQVTPACLHVAQQHAEWAFLYQWQAATALENDDMLNSVWSLLKARRASAQLSREVDRIAELNSW